MGTSTINGGDERKNHPSMDNRWESHGNFMGQWWIFHRTYMGIPIMEHGISWDDGCTRLIGDSYQPVYGIGVVFMWLAGTDLHVNELV